MTAEESARCAAIRDSMFAFPPESLPRVQSRGPVVKGLPRFIGPSEKMDLQFLVRPDGSVDTGSVRVEGAIDVWQARSYIVQQIRGYRYVPAELSGCRVWSRVLISITNLGIVRVLSP